MAKRASIFDVAAAAAVSVSTVSNVMNRPSTVAGPTRERVLLVISELGYERDENAALLRLGKKVIRRQPPPLAAAGSLPCSQANAIEGD